MFNLLQCGSCHGGAKDAWPRELGTADLAPSLDAANRRLRYEWISLWIKDPQGLIPGTKMPTFFPQSQTGVFNSPFASLLDSPRFAEPRARLMEHFGSEQELTSFLDEADAVIEVMSDYIWSLGKE